MNRILFKFFFAYFVAIVSKDCVLWLNLGLDMLLVYFVLVLAHFKNSLIMIWFVIMTNVFLRQINANFHHWLRATPSITEVYNFVLPFIF
jgi:hypothetical protein